MKHQLSYFRQEYLLTENTTTDTVVGLNMYRWIKLRNKTCNIVIISSGFSQIAISACEYTSRATLTLRIIFHCNSYSSFPFQRKWQRTKPFNIAANTKIPAAAHYFISHQSPLRKKAQQVTSKICSKSVMNQIKQTWQAYRNIIRNQCSKAYFIPQKPNSLH